MIDTSKIRNKIPEKIKESTLRVKTTLRTDLPIEQWLCLIDVLRNSDIETDVPNNLNEHLLSEIDYIIEKEFKKKLTETIEHMTGSLGLNTRKIVDLFMVKFLKYGKDSSVINYDEIYSNMKSYIKKCILFISSLKKLTENTKKNSRYNITLKSVYRKDYYLGDATQSYFNSRRKVFLKNEGDYQVTLNEECRLTTHWGDIVYRTFGNSRNCSSSEIVKVTCAKTNKTLLEWED